MMSSKSGRQIPTQPSSISFHGRGQVEAVQLGSINSTSLSISFSLGFFVLICQSTSAIPVHTSIFASLQFIFSFSNIPCTSLSDTHIIAMPNALEYEEEDLSGDEEPSTPSSSIHKNVNPAAPIAGPSRHVPVGQSSRNGDSNRQDNGNGKGKAAEVKRIIVDGTYIASLRKKREHPVEPVEMGIVSLKASCLAGEALFFSH